MLNRWPAQLPRCKHSLTHSRCHGYSKYNFHLCEALSIASYLFTVEWTETPLSSPVAHAQRFLMSWLAYMGPMILWLVARRTNHSTIATRQPQSIVREHLFQITSHIHVQNQVQDDMYSGWLMESWVNVDNYFRWLYCTLFSSFWMYMPAMRTSRISLLGLLTSLSGTKHAAFHFVSQSGTHGILRHITSVWATLRQGATNRPDARYLTLYLIVNSFCETVLPLLVVS